MRAAYAALLLGLLGGLGLTTVVMSGVRPAPATVAAALALDDGPGLDARRAVAVAALIAVCMREHGLEWHAVPEPLPSIPDSSLDPVAWADRWGFGVSTVAGSPIPSPVPDPELAALARAMPSVQAVIRAALHGSPSGPGCVERATEEVYGLRERVLRPMRPALDQLEKTIDADPAAQAAVASWRGCVAGVSGGRPLEHSTLAAALVERTVRRLGDVRAGTADLATVQREERRTAGVLARCEQALSGARTRIAARYEAAFVARYGDRLAGIGAAIRSAEAAWPSAAP